MLPARLITDSNSRQMVPPANPGARLKIRARVTLTLFDIDANPAIREAK